MLITLLVKNLSTENFFLIALVGLGALMSAMIIDTNSETNSKKRFKKLLWTVVISMSFGFIFSNWIRLHFIQSKKPCSVLQRGKAFFNSINFDKSSNIAILTLQSALVRDC